MREVNLPILVGKPDDGSSRINFPEFESEPQRVSSVQPKPENPASFSRFMLPFAYHIEENAHAHTAQPDLFYSVNSKDNLSFIKRRKYLTRDTGGVLYERSIWMDMCAKGWGETDWGKGKVPVTLRGRDLLIGMLPPRIVLFEAENEFGPGKNDTNSLPLLKSGLLLVDLYFPDQDTEPELDDLLQLNEFFRFLGMPYDSHEVNFRRNFGNIPATYTTDHKAKKISELGKLGCYFERWANLLEIEVKNEGKLYRLFPKKWGENSRKLSYNHGAPQYEDNWQIYDDNRTYVWTAAFQKKGSPSLDEVFNPLNCKDSVRRPAAKDFGHWLRLLNVDNSDSISEGNSHANVSQFEREWLDKRTYKRWENSGSWYGYTSHSGAVLSTSQNAFAPWSSYYFDTSMLLFYIRLSLFRFSYELTKTFKNGKSDDLLKDDFRTIRKKFSKFTVLYQFPLLSNQQQHVEMYELNRKYFEIEKFFNEIKEEVDNTHDFLESVGAANLTKSANKLSNAAIKLAKVGIPLAAGGLIAGIFGINSFHIYEGWLQKRSFEFDILGETVLIVAASFLAYLCTKKWFNGE